MVISGYVQKRQPKDGILTNLEISKQPGAFIAAYEKAKAEEAEMNRFNTAKISLTDQITRFDASSFSDEDNKALDEDLTYI